MDNKRLQAMSDLVAIESTVQNLQGLRAAYEFMVAFVRNNAKGVTIEEFERNGKPSFLAYKGPKRPDRFHIILNGHVDVVPAEPRMFKLTTKGDRIYGRGVHDMKAACIVMAEVFCEFIDKVPFALGFQIVTDEEIGGKDCTHYQIKQGVRADFVICGECGRSLSCYEIANEAKGIVFANVEFLGESAHGAYPWRGENAAIRATHFIETLHAVYPTPTKESPKTTVTVTTITSTAGVFNQLPKHALVKLDCRYTVNDPHFQDKEHFTSFVKSIAPDATVTFDIFSPPMYADPDSSFMNSLKKAAETVEGHVFKLVRRHAGSDGRHYLPVGGQACEFGIAGEHQHSENEYITRTSLKNYSDTLRAFINLEAYTVLSAPRRTHLDERPHLVLK